MNFAGQQRWVYWSACQQMCLSTIRNTSLANREIHTFVRVKMEEFVEAIAEVLILAERDLCTISEFFHLIQGAFPLPEHADIHFTESL